MSRFFKKCPRARPETDAKLTSFWNSLRHISPRNGILRFSIKHYLLPDHVDKIYIRRAYEDLFALISKDLNPANPQDRLHRFTITGTPGIGKSIFIFYLFWRLANEETVKAVIFRREGELGCIYVFQHDGCWETFDYDDLDELLDDPATWYLVDSYVNRPAEVKAITIFVTPVKLQHDMCFSYSAAAQPYYLPVWSLEELKVAASLSRTRVKEVEERYSFIGGIPRYIFDKDFDLKCDIDNTMLGLAWGFLEFAFQAKSDSNKIGHFIIHYLVDSTYSDYSLVFSSKYVTSLALKGLLTSGEQLRRVFFPMKSSPEFSGLQANLFEYLAHRLLSIGGKFVMRSLDDETMLELNIPQRTPQMFHNLSECIDPNVYYVPWSWNYSCVDSIVLGTGCFRMTMTGYPAIPEDEMKRIARELKVDKFYFVVPEHIFEMFRRQKLAEAKECRDATMEQTVEGQAAQEQVPMRRFSDAIPNIEPEITITKDAEDPQTDFLRQYVICIPLEQDSEIIYHAVKSTCGLLEEEEKYRKAIMANRKGG
jgi:hypothetical protein